MATKTFEELKQMAIQIRDEKTNKQNTATRIGTQMLEHLNKLEQEYYNKENIDEQNKQTDVKFSELEYKTAITIIPGSKKPNINTANHTLELDGASLLVNGNKYISMTGVTSVDYILETTTAVLIIYDTESNTLKAVTWTSTIGSNEILLGYIKANKATSELLFAYFPFEYTIDGNEILRRNSLQINSATKNITDINELDYTVYSGSDNVGGRIRFKSNIIMGSNVSATIGSTYYIALVQLQDETTIYDTGWQDDINEKINDFRINNIIINVRKKDNTNFSEEDIENAISSISISFDAINKDETSDIIAAQSLVQELINKNSLRKSSVVKISNITDINELEYTIGGTGNRLFYNDLSVFLNCNIEVSTENTKYNIAVRLKNNNSDIIYDSGWVTSYKEIISDNDVAVAAILARKSDNSSFVDNEITELIESIKINIDTLSYNDQDKVEIPDVQTVCKIANNKKEVSRDNYHGILSVAHQGFSKTSDYFGRSRLSSIQGAWEQGFDIVEVDIKYTSDDIAVCCHDLSFVDATTQETVVIAEHTYEQLKTYDYYGETIASFDEAVKLAKELGLSICIDHCPYIDTENKQDNLLSIVKKYQMQDRIYWFCGGLKELTNKILEFYKKSKIVFVTTDLVSSNINGATLVLSDYNEIIVDFNYANTTVEELIAFIESADARIKFWVWTIDDIEIYNNYKPYVSAITSNKLSEYNTKIR